MVGAEASQEQHLLRIVTWNINGLRAILKRRFGSVDELLKISGTGPFRPVQCRFEVTEVHCST